MREYLVAAIILVLVGGNGTINIEEEEEDEGWPRPTVVKALLIHIHNVERNCSLTLTDQKYPLQYPDGRGSSHQFVVGCVPTTHQDLSDKRYLWQLQGVSSEVDYDLDALELLKNGSSFALVNWKLLRYLNSHNVASPMSRKNYEVSGFANYQKKRKDKVFSELTWEVLLDSPDSAWFTDLNFTVRHLTTGQRLTVTGEVYPESWGQGMLEVAGTKEGREGSTWTVKYWRPPTVVEQFDIEHQNELYGEGTSDKTTQFRNKVNNTQSSIADLKILHKREVDLIKLLEQSEDASKTVEKVFAEDGFTLDSVLYSDVLHPVDSYNLIKRTARTWNRIFAQLSGEENLELRSAVSEAMTQFPVWESSRVAVGLGILNIHVYYRLDPADLVQGILTDKLRNVTYQSRTRLSAGDVKLIAEVAESENLVRFAIEWLRLFPQLRKRYKKLVKLHDNLVNYEPQEALKHKVVTFNDPVEETVFQETEMRRLRELNRAQCPPFQGDDPPGCTNSCLDYFYADEISQLCQGERSLRPPSRDTNTKCELLHYNSPFLRLNPFKFETSNNEGNIVAIVHQLMSPAEVEEMKKKAIGDMKATPYNIGGEQKEFSYKRNSKIKYISERVDSLALRISRRMEDALALRVFQPKHRLTAENYQLMNYGFGGLISLHLDSEFGGQDSYIGGGRFTTAMVYLSEVQSGGFTIFPKLNLFFKPELGQLLYWNLKRTDGSVDQRMNHLGCPVLYGDKWILNKWIRWEAQMKTFKCFLPKGMNFPSNKDVLLQYQ